MQHKKYTRKARLGHSEKLEATNAGENIPQLRECKKNTLVSLGWISVLLTPKQLEFIERLSEYPEWDDKLGIPMEFVTWTYAQELGDTMSPMVVGAIITTLKKKGILVTKEYNLHGIKGSIFKLTPLGIQVYNIVNQK